MRSYAIKHYPNTSETMTQAQSGDSCRGIIFSSDFPIASSNSKDVLRERLKKDEEDNVE
jgi:hypothetical protein